MAKTSSRQSPSTIDFTDPQYYFNRELSWLEFNARVLAEGLDDRTLLLDRLKFLAIFSSNLDEFFMVRVAGLKQQVAADVHKLTPDGHSPSDQLESITQRLRPLLQQQDQTFENHLRTQLASEGVYLVNHVDLNQEQRQYLHDYFDEHISPVLTPLAVDPSHPFPYISNLSLNLAVLVKDPDTNEELFARIKVPRVLSRFVKLPKHLRQAGEVPAVWTGIPIEQVIAHNLDTLFPGMHVQECYPFRITRNADLSVEEDEADDLLLAIEQELRKRRFGGSAVRMEIQASMPDSVRSTLMRALELEDDDVFAFESLLGLNDLMSLAALPLPHLKEPGWTPIVPLRIQRMLEAAEAKHKLDRDDGENIFDLITHGDLLVHHPYHSFRATVQEFITQAAEDPQVLAIKMTLYRTSGDSPIVNALISAAENGKQVVALVELKARFDEENNIQWAKQLERAGVHVVYGLVGLKTHTKITLVVRQEEEHIRRYVHIGTGNYNPKTARLYTDLGLLSRRDDLGADLTDLFNYLTGYSRQKSYRRLLVSPVNLRDRMTALIDREIAHSQAGASGRIVAKMNSLVDPKIIAKLYAASQAGVQIDLIIRGICCLRPGLPGVSDNINVISIVGNLLEHSRIFYFHNQGTEEIYIGSADWMRRNLDRRVEAVTPIDDPTLRADLQEILGIMLADNRQAWELQPDGSYVQRHPPAPDQSRSSQKLLMEMTLHQGGF
ncbi:polyphosphate kinase 1 [Spirulina major]|uniref:polyphosphate kinase 1 n=1 Tax=Spirulina major TaxID=270636 RepID=UPI000934A697|nr:polyphosphate kinase 1 [Spirulina major]